MQNMRYYQCKQLIRRNALFLLSLLMEREKNQYVWLKLKLQIGKLVGVLLRGNNNLLEVI